MEKRILGKTNEEISIIGLDLEKLFKNHVSQDMKLYLEKSIINGVNFFEISPRIELLDETIVFPLNLHRDKLFISGRVYSKNRDEILEDINYMLKIFNLQNLDLIQIVVNSDEMAQTIFAPEGALEAILQAKSQGLINYIGFSTYKEKIALSLLESYNFDVITFPIDWVNWYAGYGRKTVIKAKEKGTAIVSSQSLTKKVSRANTEKHISDLLYVSSDSYREVELTIRFSLTRPITSILCSAKINLIEWLIQAADRFSPLEPEDEEKLRKSCEEIVKVFNPEKILKGDI